MNLTRRGFAKVLPSLGVLSAGCRPEAGGSSFSLLTEDPRRPEPAGYDRLPLEWYKRAVARLKESVKELRVRAIVLRTASNITYFTGTFYKQLERRFGVLLPMDSDDIFWYGPAIDRDLLSSWWCTDLEYYFDYKHAAAAYPNRGTVKEGPPVDLDAWIFRRMAKRGYDRGRIACDFDPGRYQDALAGSMDRAEFIDIRPQIKAMRLVRTPEEIALAQRAMDYLSRAHAYARDFILKEGLGLTNLEISAAISRWGAKMVLDDLKPSGRPHTAVGLSLKLSCKVGVQTGYPHATQAFYETLKRGDALQINGIYTVGGYGGELYRCCQTAPWDAHREKLWQVVADCVQIQLEESRPGVKCSTVARKIHEHQVRSGVAQYVYHRPGHGFSGLEPHEEPYLSLGDDTVMEEGMTFSVEPGLYDTANGFGFNPSDNMLVTRDGGVLMSSIPFTKEWMFFEI